MQSKINLVSDFLVPALTVALTCTLFAVFAPHDASTLYWFNMAYVAVLEILLFGYIKFSTGGHHTSVAFRMAGGVYTLVYIAAALVWLLIYAAALRFVAPLKLYFAVIAVLTMLWIICTAFTLKADAANTGSVQTIGQNRRLTDELRMRAELLSATFASRAGTEPDLAGIQGSFGRLIHSLSSVSPAVMADARSAATLDSICDTLEAMLGGAAAPAQVKAFCETAIAKVNLCKSKALK